MIKGKRQRGEDKVKKLIIRQEKKVRREKSCCMKLKSFSSCALVEAQPGSRAAVLIPLPCPLTREDLSRFPLRVWRSTSLSSPHFSRLSLHSSEEHLQSLHPTPKACKKGETLFVKASVSLPAHTHTHLLHANTNSCLSLYPCEDRMCTACTLLPSCLPKPYSSLVVRTSSLAEFRPIYSLFLV